MPDIRSCGSVNHENTTMHAEQESPVPCSSSRKAFTTRRSSVLFLLGNGITKEDTKITDSRRPNSLQVLRCMMYHLNEGLLENRTRWEAAKLVLNKVTIFYEKANIPVICDRKVRKDHQASGRKFKNKSNTLKTQIYV